MFSQGFLTLRKSLSQTMDSRISQLPSTPRAIVYSLLGKTPVDPSLVLFVVQPMTGMLLNEAAMRCWCRRERAFVGTADLHGTADGAG